MSLDEEFNKGRMGAKRSSWAKVHYRDLGLKVYEAHPNAEVEDLAQWFLEELEKHPEFLQSIAVYIMANVKSALSVPRARPRNTQALETEIIHSIAEKTVTVVLMSLTLPSGKTLAASTGAECNAAGGWLARIGERVGPAGIVGECLTEAELQKMWQQK
jgi:hypothetical protein